MEDHHLAIPRVGSATSSTETCSVFYLLEEQSDTHTPQHRPRVQLAYSLRVCLVIQACVYGCLCGGNQEWQLPNQVVAFSLPLAFGSRVPQKSPELQWPRRPRTVHHIW